MNVRERWVAFQERNHLHPDGIPGHRTLNVVERLEADAADAITKPIPRLTMASPIPWYHSALGELGVREKRGTDHDQRVLEYLATCHKSQGGNLGDWAVSVDETPWCAAFVGWCLLRAGLPSTHSAWAKSYLDYGTSLEAPHKGAIAVLTRGSGGHVAFVDRVTDDHVHLLGGNQGNRVSVQPYDKARVLAYRWPPEG